MKNIHGGGPHLPPDRIVEGSTKGWNTECQYCCIFGGSVPCYVYELLHLSNLLYLSDSFGGLFLPQKIGIHALAAFTKCIARDLKWADLGRDV